MAVTNNLLTKSFRFFFVAIREIFIERKYLKFVVMAFFLNLLLFIAMIYGFVVGTEFLETNYIDRFAITDNTFANALINISQFLISIFLAAILFPTFSSLVNALTYEPLVDKILDEAKIEEIHPKTGIRGAASIVWHAIAFEVKKLSLSLSILVLSLPLLLIPLLGQIVFSTIGYFNIILTNGSDSFSPAFSRQEARYRSILQFILKRPTLWPYLLMTGTLHALPVINIFSIPVAVIANTRLFVYAREKDAKVAQLIT